MNYAKSLSAVSLLTGLYFCEGLPFAIVVAMPVVYLKNCGLDNTHITLWTSLLALPWTLKGLWAPLVDRCEDLKKWIVCSQVLAFGLMATLALAAFCQSHYFFILCLFAVLGLVAATQDLAIDAHYLSTYNAADQSRLMWLRNTAFRIAYLLGAGVLISFAGMVAEQTIIKSSVSTGWAVAFAISALLFGTAAICNFKSLTKASCKVQGPINSKSSHHQTLPQALRAFNQIPGIWRIVSYVLVFRLGDAFLSSIAQPFLLDSRVAGGLDLKTSTVGLIYGTVGSISLIAGGMVGGLFIAARGARCLLIPFSLLQSLSLLGYYFLATARVALPVVCAVNSFEQLTFGLSTACYSVVLLTAVDPRYKATHFAVICAIMNFGLIVPGMLAGAMSDRLGYANYFMLSFLLSLCGPLISRLLPDHDVLKAPGKITA
jgi:PAT family beta-lactamase induction signal transducer AmpG